MDALNRRSVLLVEDDEAAREILASILALKFPHLTCYVADNGKTGLEQFITHSPGIVITDINMPIMDGITMAEKIKAIAGGVKLIVLTAFSDKTILGAAKASGLEIKHRLLKPVDYGKLFAAMEQCLTESGYEKIPPLIQGNDDDKK